jgi:hypothetical protein
MFLMGENFNFPARNGSIISFISQLGGGTTSFFDSCGNGDDTQTVNAPFTGPVPVSSLTYACSGGFVGTGTGKYITQASANLGAGLVFAPGTLSNAKAGSLTTILDVNFMTNDFGAANQALTENLIGFVNNPVGTTPEPASLVLIGSGLLGLGVFGRKRLSR